MNVQLAHYLARFNALPGYLDFARIGPISHDVATTLTEAVRLCQGDSAVEALAEHLADARRSAAQLLGAAEHEVAFVSSTSHALFAAAAALSTPTRAHRTAPTGTTRTGTNQPPTRAATRIGATQSPTNPLSGADQTPTSASGVTTRSSAGQNAATAPGGAIRSGAGLIPSGALGGAGGLGGGLGGGRGVVLVRRGEFPANVYPWLRFQEHGGLKVRWIDAPRVTPEVLAAHLTPEVRALAVSAVDALTGYRAPLGALKEVLGQDRVLVVDAIQGLGAVPLEVEAADVLACGGQKWLRAGWGAALLLVRDRVADRLSPTLGGWSGIHNPLTEDTHPHELRTGEAPAPPTENDRSGGPNLAPWPEAPPTEGDRSGGPDLAASPGNWVGGYGPAGGGHPREPLAGAMAHTLTNPDYPAVAALGTAIDLVLGVGVDAIATRVSATLAALLEAARAAGARIMLDDLAPDQRGGIACLHLPGHDPARVHTAITAAGLTATLRGPWIRLSPHATTPHEAADRLAEGLRAAHGP